MDARLLLFWLRIPFGGWGRNSIWNSCNLASLTNDSDTGHSFAKRDFLTCEIVFARFLPSNFKRSLSLAGRLLGFGCFGHSF